MQQIAQHFSHRSSAAEMGGETRELTSPSHTFTNSQGLADLSRVVTTASVSALLQSDSPEVSALQRAVQHLVVEARAVDSTRVERLLIPLRQAWREMPAVRHMSDPSAPEALWDVLVRLCVEEFYGHNSQQGRD